MHYSFRRSLSIRFDIITMSSPLYANHKEVDEKQAQFYTNDEAHIDGAGSFDAITALVNEGKRHDVPRVIHGERLTCYKTTDMI